MDEPKPPKYRLTKERKHPVLGPYIPKIKQIMEEDKTQTSKTTAYWHKDIRNIAGRRLYRRIQHSLDYLRKEYRKQREAFFLWNLSLEPMRK
jgi:hypothetical protein